MGSPDRQQPSRRCRVAGGHRTAPAVSAGLVVLVGGACATADSTTAATSAPLQASSQEDSGIEAAPVGMAAEVSAHVLAPAPLVDSAPSPTATVVVVESWPSEAVRAVNWVEFGDDMFVTATLTRTQYGDQAMVLTSIDGQNWTRPSDYPVDLPADSYDIDIERVGEWWAATATANYSDVLRISKDLINWQTLSPTLEGLGPAPEGMYWQSKLELNAPSATFGIRTKLWNDLSVAGTDKEQPQPTNSKAITRIVSLTDAGTLETLYETTGMGNLLFHVVVDLGDGDMVVAVRDGNWKTYDLNSDESLTGTSVTFPDSDLNSTLRLAAHNGRIYAQAAPNPTTAELVVSEDRGRTWQTAATFESGAVLVGLSQFATGPNGSVAAVIGEGATAVVYAADGVNFEQVDIAERTGRESTVEGLVASQYPVRDLAINDDQLVFLTDLDTQINTIELTQ